MKALLAAVALLAACVGCTQQGKPLSHCQASHKPDPLCVHTHEVVRPSPISIGVIP